MSTAAARPASPVELGRTEERVARWMLIYPCIAMDGGLLQIVLFVFVCSLRVRGRVLIRRRHAFCRSSPGRQHVTRVVVVSGGQDETTQWVRLERKEGGRGVLPLVGCLLVECFDSSAAVIPKL